ncbi:MAG: hypothetical protein AAF572_13290 [Cyanobacteria bacterium P01_B01_bin.77]
MSFTDSTLPTDFSIQPATPGSTIRHILLGQPNDIRQTIHLLHNLRYVETSQWSTLIEVPDNRLILRPPAEHMISMLVRRL